MEKRNRDLQLTNLLAEIPDTLLNEQFDQLLLRPGLKLERIISTGQITTDLQWYDQSWDEWVLILQGAARLEIEGFDNEIKLVTGDSLLLKAHQRHRVTWTQSDPATIWLALHIDSAAQADTGSDTFAS